MSSPLGEKSNTTNTNFETTIVSLYFWFRPDKLISDKEIPTLFVSQPEEFDFFTSQIGSIIITYKDRKLQIGDTLLWMVPQLCFDVITNLVRTGKGEFESWQDDSEFMFRKKGDEIFIFGPYIDGYYFPAVPFMTAMVDAGKRYIDLLEQLWTEDVAEDLPILYERMKLAEDAVISLTTSSK